MYTQKKTWSNEKDKRRLTPVKCNLNDRKREFGEKARDKGEFQLNQGAANYVAWLKNFLALPRSIRDFFRDLHFIS